jgi:coproporphyrinogen III oxidase
MNKQNPSTTHRDGKSKNELRDRFYRYIQGLQDTITTAIEKVDGKGQFVEDAWERPEGGGGIIRVIENGDVFEKGGVNISAVHGELPQSMQAYFGVGESDFYACGLSLVLHPNSPMIPTVHANWRYFELYNEDNAIVDQWFGGGQDLTPYYLFEEDAKHFHNRCKSACDSHDPEFYPRFKKACDAYFWNSHRDEARGIGGLFFDYCKAGDQKSMENWYSFVTTVADGFLEAYLPIVEKRMTHPWGPKEREWQEIRRGRYVEFNLVHDKGTLFGLKTNGRIESILMSLPPRVQWKYNHSPEPGSDEEKLLKVLREPGQWV